VSEDAGADAADDEEGCDGDEGGERESFRALLLWRRQGVVHH